MLEYAGDGGLSLFGPLCDEESKREAWERWHNTEKAIAFSECQGFCLLLHGLLTVPIQREIAKRVTPEHFEKLKRGRRTYDYSYWMRHLRRLDPDAANGLTAVFNAILDDAPQPLEMRLPFARSLRRDLEGK